MGRGWPRERRGGGHGPEPWEGFLGESPGERAHGESPSQGEREERGQHRQNAATLAHRNRSDFAICDCDAHRGPQKSQRFPRQEQAMLHCDLRVRWKVASDLRFQAAISEPKKKRALTGPGGAHTGQGLLHKKIILGGSTGKSCNSPGAIT